MQITPPFGYQEVVALHRNEKVVLLAPGEVPKFAQALNAIPISYSEFTLVSRQYPIVFTSGDNGQSFTPVAVLGITAGENLFFADGKWAAGAYVPAYARRYPFCMAKVKLNEVEQQDRLICVEKERVDSQGEPMFDEQGQPNDKWREIERLLTEYEADLERAREMCSILLDYALLEPFTMQATLTKDGAALHLTGMHRIDEKKLEHLNASQIKNLMKKGVMGRIYTHLLSLDTFTGLLERKAARAA